MSRSARHGDPAGWYLDPTGHARLRHWDGTRHEPWVSDGTDSRPDPYVAPRTPVPADAESLRFVREVFLPLARERRTVAVDSLDTLSELAWQLGDRLTEPAAVGVAAASSAASASSVARAYNPVDLQHPARVVPSQPVDRPSVVDRPVVVPEPHEPGALARWWAGAKEQVGSDLAAHGLAYLGVLLLFVGVFGLVAFAFGDVAEGTRPVAEVGIAVAPFVAAWMLLRRGAEIAGRALELAGGLLLPIMLITSFLDGVVIPPDLTGPALVVALTATTALVSAAYALWARRHTSSALRYLVAPVAWLACAMAVMGVGREIPSGGGVAVASAAQATAIAVAMVVSLLLARLRPGARLSRPTLVAAVPGTVVVALLALLTWFSASFPLVPVLVTGLCGVLVLELLDTTVPQRLARTAQPLWWGIVMLALVASLDPMLASGVAVAGAAAAIGFLVLLEVDSRATEGWPMALSASGLGIAYLLCWADPWWALAAGVVLAAWAGVRRLRPYAVTGSALVLDLVAGTLPVAAVLALGLATRHAPLAILVGSLLVLAALLPLDVPAVRWRTRRDASDHFWQLWWDAGMVLAVTAVVVLVGQFWPDVVSARWIAVATPIVLMVSAALGPVPRTWRAWPTVGLGVLSWLLVGVVLGLAPTTVAIGCAAAGLGLVLVAHLARSAVERWCDAGSLGLSGLAVGTGAVLAGISGIADGSAVVAALVSLLTLALLTVTAFDEARWSPVSAFLAERVHRFARPAVPVLTGALVPVASVLVLDATGVLAESSPWDGLVLSAVALAYAGLAHARVSATLRTILVWWATALACLAALGAGTEVAMAAVLAIVVVLPLVLPRGARPLAAQWLAWGAIAPLLGLLAVAALPSFAALVATASVPLVLVLVGGVLVVAALAYDAWTAGWATRLVPEVPWLRPALWTGAAELAVGTLLAQGAPPAWAGGITAMALVAVVAVALLQRVWAWLGLAALLGCVAVWQTWTAAVTAHAWIGLVAAALLAAGAELAWRLDRREAAWARAEVPLVAVAHVPALFALVSESSTLATAWSMVAAAALAAVLGVVVIVRRDRGSGVPFAASWNAVVGIGYVVIACGLVVAAGWLCGSGWLALALAGVSLLSTVAALRLGGGARWTLVALGSATWLAAWLCFLDWYGADWRTTSNATALLGAAVVLVCAVLLRWTALDRVTLLLRGGAGLLALVFAPLVASGSAGVDPVPDAITWWLTAALAVAAIGLGLVAAPLAQHWLRYAAVVVGAVALACAFVVAAPADAVQLAVLAAVALVTGLAVLRASWRSRLGAWAWPMILGGALAWVWAFVPALGLVPETAGVSVLLLVGAVRTGAVGTAYRMLVPRLASPLLACAAWIVWAVGALDGNPQWVTVPVGLALLVMVGQVRADRRARGQAVDGSEIVLLELVGIGTLVGASFVQAFTVSLAYALLAAGLGLGVVAWAVLTRVRRRLVAGAVVVLAALAVLVLVPLAQLLPAWSSATLWISIAGLGLVAILVATLLEQGRAVVRRGIAELHRVTDGWE